MNEVEYLGDLSDFQFIFMVTLPLLVIVLCLVVVFKKWWKNEKWLDNDYCACSLLLALIPALMFWAYYDGLNQPYEQFSGDINRYSVVYMAMSGILLVTLISRRNILHVLGVFICGSAGRYFWMAWGQEVRDNYITEDYSPFHLNRTMGWVFAVAAFVLVVVIMYRLRVAELNKLEQQRKQAGGQVAASSGSFPKSSSN